MSRKFASLDSLRKDEEDREGNEYYAGGNDARGGAPRCDNLYSILTAPSVCTRIRPGGSGLAVEGQPEHVRRLVEQAGSGRPPAERPAGAAPMKVTVYKNGFKIDDGEFRDISVEENKQFMDTIMNGHVPAEV